MNGQKSALIGLHIHVQKMCSATNSEGPMISLNCSAVCTNKGGHSEISGYILHAAWERSSMVKIDEDGDCHTDACSTRVISHSTRYMP